MTTWLRIVRATLACVFATALCGGIHGATTLDLGFVDTSGRPVALAKAELLLVAWGATERIELETTGDGLRLVLEPDWLRTRWPGRFDDQEGVYLYLEAPPLAAIRSYRFPWPGAKGDAGTTVIAFPRNQVAVVERGAKAQRTVVFRAKTVRRVRLVDTDGVPRPGAVIDACMFWSRSNHCGVLAGCDPLGRHAADADGWLEIPDGDFEYALELGRELARDHVFVAGGQAAGKRLVTELTRPETELVVYRHPVRPLAMRVRRGDEPAVGLVLNAHTADCPCGACSGPLATTDEEGRIDLPGFRPGRWEWGWLQDGEGEIWRTVPTTWPVGAIEVGISPSTGAVEASFSP